MPKPTNWSDHFEVSKAVSDPRYNKAASGHPIDERRAPVLDIRQSAELMFISSIAEGEVSQQVLLLPSREPDLLLPPGRP